MSSFLRTRASLELSLVAARTHASLVMLPRDSRAGMHAQAEIFRSSSVIWRFGPGIRSEGVESLVMMANEWGSIRSFSNDAVKGMIEFEYIRSTSEGFGLRCGEFGGYGDERWRKKKRWCDGPEPVGHTAEPYRSEAYFCEASLARVFPATFSVQGMEPSCGRPRVSREQFHSASREALFRGDRGILERGVGGVVII